MRACGHTCVWGAHTLSAAWRGERDIWSQSVNVRIARAPMLNCSVILDKSPYFPEPQFPCLVQRREGRRVQPPCMGSATQVTATVPVLLHTHVQVLGAESPGGTPAVQEAGCRGSWLCC